MAFNVELINKAVEETEKEIAETNSDLLEFYEANTCYLEDTWISEVSRSLLDKIAWSLHYTMRSEAEWMEFLNKLGIENNLIKKIKVKSPLYKETEIYIALTSLFQHKGRFSKLIDVIKECERYDVLHDIRKEVEDLIERKKNPPSSSDTSFAFSYNEDCKVENKSVYNDNKVNCEIESIQKQCALKESETNQQLLNANKEYEKIPLSVSKVKSITVFTPHAEVDYEDAKKLSTLLSEEQIIVKTPEDLDYLFSMDVSETTIALISVVDFVVPIVSEAFLRQIHPSKQFSSNCRSEELSSPSDSNNRYIYQLLFNEYLSCKCLNFRVRAVLVPNMKRSLLKFDALLFNSLQLWKDVSKLANILKKTKQKFG